MGKELALMLVQLLGFHQLCITKCGIGKFIQYHYIVY